MQVRKLVAPRTLEEFHPYLPELVALFRLLWSRAAGAFAAVLFSCGCYFPAVLFCCGCYFAAGALLPAGETRHTGFCVPCRHMCMSYAELPMQLIRPTAITTWSPHRTCHAISPFGPGCFLDTDSTVLAGRIGSRLALLSLWPRDPWAFLLLLSPCPRLCRLSRLSYLSHLSHLSRLPWTDSCI